MRSPSHAHQDPDQPPPPASPPRAPLAFRAGIVGHRPNRLRHADPPALSNVIHDVLDAVKQAVTDLHGRSGHLYGDEPPVLRAVSPIAEGTDRLFAEQALDLGYSLCCPMPFSQAEYENDFLPGQALEERSQERFHGLLDRARAGPGLVVYELDGSRDDPGAAYGAAGRVVLIQSDLLIVVWDGGEPQGRGGTVQTLEEAVRFQVPVVWIDAVAPHPWRLLQSEADLACLRSNGRCSPGVGAPPAWEELKRIVRRVIEWPPGDAEAAKAREHQAEILQVFLNERRPRWNPMFIWKAFRDLVGSGRLTLQSFGVPDFEAAVAGDWPTAAQGTDPTVAEWVNERLRPHYAWSDKLADFWGDHYRSAFVSAYLMAALAVLLALLPTAAGWDGPAHWARAACIIAEFVTVASILTLVFWGRSRRWHDRWMEYRLLAEFIRQLRFLIPLGGGRPSPRLPAQLSAYGDPFATWMFWQTQAIARATGLPGARVTHDYLVQCLDYLKRIVRGQRAFHETNWRRSERIERRLHGAVLGLLMLTLLSIAVHLLPHLQLPGLPAEEPSGRLQGWLMLACAGFPALGAALAGINDQGEFARIAKRSRAMSERLEKISTTIEDLEQRADRTVAPLCLRQVLPLADGMAQVMVDEVLDWRVVFKDRPLLVHT